MLLNLFLRTNAAYILNLVCHNLLYILARIDAYYLIHFTHHCLLHILKFWQSHAQFFAIDFFCAYLDIFFGVRDII